MKRSEHLLPLSHEHHHGLLFCSRLQKADNANSKTLQSYIVGFWEHSLQRHFDMEEELFLPLLKDEEPTLQFRKEHQQIRQLVSSIKTSEKGMHEYALTLAKLTNDHIRFEEREFFPWLEKKLSPGDMSTIGSILSKIEISAYDFPDPFWKT